MYIPLSLCVGCVYEYRYSGKPEEGVRFPGNGVTDGCDIPDMETWELNLAPSTKAASVLN